MNSKIERWFPLFAASVITVANLFFLHQYQLANFAANLFNATISLGSIIIGFLATAKSILFAIDQKFVVQQLKTSGTYKKLINYFMDAIHWAFLLVIADILGLTIDFSVPANWHYTAFGAWIFTLSMTMLSCYRVIYVFTRILKSS